MSNIAIIRKTLLDIPSVNNTWFEWELDRDGQSKTLVVEVHFDTDPNSPDFDSSALDDIRTACLDTLQNKTSMVVSRIKVVPVSR